MVDRADARRGHRNTSGFAPRAGLSCGRALRRGPSPPTDPGAARSAQADVPGWSSRPRPPPGGLASVVDGASTHAVSRSLVGRPAVSRHLAALWSAYVTVWREVPAPRASRGGRLTQEAARIGDLGPRVTVALRRRGERTVELVAFDCGELFRYGQGASGEPSRSWYQAIALVVRLTPAASRQRILWPDRRKHWRAECRLYVPQTAGASSGINAVPEIGCNARRWRITAPSKAEKRTVHCPRRGRIRSVRP
jgi:hypothetical protein